MMTIPGLGLFYGGMVRKKNVGDTVMTSFAVTCLVTILFAAVTYSMSFTAGSPYIGGLSRAFLQDILSDIAKGEFVLGKMRPAGYVALLAYVEMTPANEAVLNSAREFIRDRTKAATCLGFGPRTSTTW